MKLYVFASSNLTNIWAGIGARLWAVAKSQADHVGGITAKALRMLPGSLGVLYCSETKSFTTPFVVYSVPREGAIIGNVWPEEWTLPFGIQPLGTPHRQLTTDRAKELLPILRGSDRSWHHIIQIQATTAFVPTEIGEEDWRIFVEELADREVAVAHLQ